MDGLETSLEEEDETGDCTESTVFVLEERVALWLTLDDVDVDDIDDEADEAAMDEVGGGWVGHVKEVLERSEKSVETPAHLNACKTQRMLQIIK